MDPKGSTVLLAGTLAATLWCGPLTAAQGHGPNKLREFIDRQVGGIHKLMVPASNADLPVPRGPDGRPDPQFKTTEAKRYLGKMLFHDPGRAVRIRPEFGGVPATAGTTSCGSCHLGEAASKAGALLNFAAGGEGRGYTDARGNFVARRRPNVALLPRLRDTPLFPGDALVDSLPTLADIYRDKNTGAIVAGSPALQRKLDRTVFDLIATGRLDALDSVARNAPSVIGAAFNNRLLQGGFAGEPDNSPGALNPFGHGAQENVALLLLDAHRMLDDGTGLGQSDALKAIPAFVKLFRDAFPEEARQADLAGDPNLLINNLTVLRATATFMRTVITRNTPWDKFLAGDNSALTPRQQRGARLFFTRAPDGGAGCFSCHSGPALNKQVEDPDVTGTGEFVEDNFFNLGLADHPVQALNRAVKGPDFRDDGRREITGNFDDAFKFRVLTLRQVKDGRFFFHNGSFSSVKEVVNYFNAGIPQDPVAAAAGTLSERFTHPRGPGTPPGLGLNERQVDDLTDFLEHALHDPAFVSFDPKSTTDTFEPNVRDLTYSVYRPDLAALGAIDLRMPSGRPPNNDDALSRRDMGLEFLDVSAQIGATLLNSNRSKHDKQHRDLHQLTNQGASAVDTHLLVVVQGLSKRIRLKNASGITREGDPYVRVFLRDGALQPGQSIVQALFFEGPAHAQAWNYSLKILSGQGNP